MALDYGVSIWELGVAAFSITSALIGNTYMIKHNSKELERLRDEDIKNLNEKCNEMISEEAVRIEFVQKALYNNEVTHLNKTMDEIKLQNNKILEYIRK